MTEADAAYQQGYDRGIAVIEAIADGMRDSGWPGFEVRRWADGFWTATFYRYTKFSGCEIKAQGKGSTIWEAISKAKEKADAQHS